MKTTGYPTSIKKVMLIFILLATNIISGGCTFQEHYKLLVDGELEITTYTDEKICFRPNFDTAKTADNNIAYKKLNYIAEGYYMLVDRTTVESNMKPMYVYKLPEHQIIRDKSEYCMDLNSSSIDMKGNRLYDLSINGKDDTGKYLVTFSKEFSYQTHRK